MNFTRRYLVMEDEEVPDAMAKAELLYAILGAWGLGFRVWGLGV